MIGILFSPKGERPLAAFLSGNEEIRRSGIPVLVFSIPNLNLSDRSVCGTLVSGGRASAVKTGLPSRIFNFAVQLTKSHIKTLKNLAEIPEIKVVNAVNVFNQWSIMKMLAADPVTGRYVLPCALISTGNLLPDFQKKGSFLLKPRNGSSVKRIVYGRKTGNGFDVYNIGDIPRSHLFDIQSAVLPTIKSGRWLCLDSPELVTRGNQLLILRGYLYRDRGKWEVAQKTAVLQNDRTFRTADEKTDAALLRMARYIHCYLPDQAFFAIDFVLGTDGTPYFLNLSGWQDLSPGKRRHKVLREILCQCVASCAGAPGASDQTDR